MTALSVDKAGIEMVRAGDHGRRLNHHQPAPIQRLLGGCLAGLRTGQFDFVGFVSFDC
jgi:hypothetical protein